MIEGFIDFYRSILWVLMSIDAKSVGVLLGAFSFSVLCGITGSLIFHFICLYRKRMKR